MNKKIKNENGAISLFVLLSMMFFLVFMLGAFTMVNRRNMAQAEALTETKRIYSSNISAKDQYDSIFSNNTSSVIPVTNIDQLKMIKEVKEKNIKYKYLENGKLYSYENSSNYILQNDIILDFDDTINNKKNLNEVLLDYMLYNSNYKIDMNGHSIYYKKKSDGSVWKLVCYHNAIDESHMFSTSSTATNYYGKSYLSDRFSILEDGIYPYSHPWGAEQNYEFLLMFSTTTKDASNNYVGDVFDTSKNYNRWRQKNNPKDEDKGTEDGTLMADGYDVSFDGASTSLGTTNYWGGLTKSTTTKCYLKGSVGSTQWFFAVGATSYYSNFGIPASTSYKNNYDINTAKEELLFVRYK